MYLLHGHKITYLNVPVLEEKINTITRMRNNTNLLQTFIIELKKLNPQLGTVFLCAGWYATLSTMLFENDFDIKCVRRW